MAILKNKRKLNKIGKYLYLYLILILFEELSMHCNEKQIKMFVNKMKNAKE